jgi:hypothetical protein
LTVSTIQLPNLTGASRRLGPLETLWRTGGETPADKARFAAGHVAHLQQQCKIDLFKQAVEHAAQLGAAGPDVFARDLTVAPG